MNASGSSPISVALTSACAAVLLTSCVYQKQVRDIDRQPVVNTGAGATIIYPGQTAPPAPGSAPPGAASSAAPAGGAPDPVAGRGAASQSGSGSAPGGGGVTFIGGSSTDEKRHLEVDEQPLYYKYLLAPFAIAAAPFVAIADAFRDDEEPGPPLPETAPAQPPPPPQTPPPTDYESRRLEALERELAQRSGAETPAPGTPPVATAAPRPRVSIADELASLQRTPQAPAPSGPRTPEPARAPAPSGAGAGPATGPLAVADGIVDRDGDGRIDQWIFRENGDIVRKLDDQDGDGRPDRTLHYDPETHRLRRLEEDTNHDGSVDSWSDFRAGELVRRRVDADRDGIVDSWSFFDDERLTRHEQDTTGDGFRDRVTFYEHGAIVREERDENGDGRTDVTVHFDSRSEVSRREEDTDGDGRVDVISHYENGRLSRRELLDPSALAQPEDAR